MLPIYIDQLQTLRYHAARGGYFEVQYLLNKGVDPDTKDSFGQTALMLAARGSHKEVVEALINSGADLHSCDGDDWTALHHSSYGGSVEIVQSLIKEGVALDVKNSHGQTPLMLAVRSSHGKVAEVLINSGADLLSSDHDGWTALHYAVWNKSLDIVQCHVSEGVSLDMKNCNGETPLHLSILLDRIEITDCLLKAGADCNLEDYNGGSPFSIHIGAERNHVETIKLCIDKGAYVKSGDYNKLVEDPLLKEVILQDVKVCSQAVINKFNNRDLPLLYEGLVQKLPHIDKIKIGKGSGIALEVEQAVTHEIRAKGFCNLFEMVPLVLSILCVKSLTEKLRSAFDQPSRS